MRLDPFINNTRTIVFFFRFYEYFITSKIYPELVIEGMFTVEIIESALVYDSLSATHPLLHYEESPGIVREFYDTITYNKCK